MQMRTDQPIRTSARFDLAGLRAAKLSIASVYRGLFDDLHVAANTRSMELQQTSRQLP